MNNIDSEKIISKLKDLQHNALCTSLEDYMQGFSASDILSRVDFGCYYDRHAFDVLYKGIALAMFVEERSFKSSQSSIPTISFFDLNTIREHDPKYKPEYPGSLIFDKKPFKILIEDLLKKHPKNIDAVLDNVFISSQTFSRLKSGMRNITLEILALFSLSLKLSAKEAYEFIFNCEDLNINIDTAWITYAGLMYSLETKEYDTIEYTQCAIDCFRAQNGGIPYSIHNWYNDYNAYTEDVESDDDW